MDQYFIDRLYEDCALEKTRQARPDNFPSLPPIPAQLRVEPRLAPLIAEAHCAASMIYTNDSSE